MKLEITETRRSCNRVSGKISYDVTSKVEADINLGIVNFSCVGKRVFTIDEINNDTIRVTIHNVNSTNDDSFDIQLGEKVIKETTGFFVYAVGYKYEFELN